MKRHFAALVSVVLIGAMATATRGNCEPVKTQPRIVLCILHDRPEVIRAVCAQSRFFEFDEQYSGCGRDERMLNAFEYSWDRVRPSATDDDKRLVEEHRDVAYVLSRRLEAERSVEIALEGLALVEKVFAEGARAVKCDSSGIAHGKQRWLDFASKRTPLEAYFAFVRRPLGSDVTMYSCGMHLVGLPDVKVVGFADRDAAVIMDSFAGYLLTEGGDRTISPGHTFSCSPGDPVLRISHEECRDYAADDFFYNPYGCWVLERKDPQQDVPDSPDDAPRTRKASP